jgi:hypothetical protein
VGSTAQPYNGRPICGGNLDGTQVLLELVGTQLHFSPVQLRVLQSTDGSATWTEPASDPAYLADTLQCQFAGPNLFVAENFFDDAAATVFASSDLASWGVQAYRPEWTAWDSPGPSGSAALGSALYFANGNTLYAGTP